MKSVRDPFAPPMWPVPVRPEVLRSIAHSLFVEQGADIGLWVDCDEMTREEANWLMEKHVQG